MIDIDPESTNNRIRLRPAGLVTVVAFGSASFAVADVDTATVRFADAAIARRGTGTLHLSMSDVNVDGIPDLVMKFRVLDTSLGVGDSTATLTGFTLGLVPFAGSDTIEVR